MNISYGIIAVHLPEPMTDPMVLLVHKKATLHFVSFVRGYYPLGEQFQTFRMFTMMTEEEKTLIRTKTFEELWQICMGNHGTDYQKNLAKRMYDQTRLDSYYDQYLTAPSIYENPEWEFPKGRKHRHETELNTALREFSEETGISLRELTPSRIPVIRETIIGTNMQKYTNSYYVYYIKRQDAIKDFKPNAEMQAAKWVPLSELINDFNSHFRPYYAERKTLLQTLSSELKLCQVAP